MKRGRPAKTEWKVSASTAAMNTSNPIRQIVDKMNTPPNKEKPMIPLSLGDPCVFGNFPAPQGALDNLIENVKSQKHSGYVASVGTAEARAAIAKRFSRDSAPLTEKDIVIASGCSGALDMAITVLCNPGDNILLPSPGFPLYQTLADHKGIEVRHYSLLPEKQWEADLDSLESLIDEKTGAILVNNPSNPCGSVYSKQHLEAILALAEKHHVPIISDEIYADMVFTGETFFALSSLTSTVPILTVGGLAKQYFVPGWRVGWIMIHDRNNVFESVREGLARLSTLIIGACNLIQSAIPHFLLETPQKFYEDSMALLEKNANVCVEGAKSIPTLECVLPQGAMYAMMKIKIENFKFKDDVEFANKLLEEESVFVLPGQCFRMPNFFRIVFCAPEEKLKEAFDRMRDFCARHSK